ncbi:MAG: methyltransferase [Steroidobacteraceae bacterium]|nr:class I SAM-dependent RNA methyltransferase [Steroidobacteraceae bacterium]MBP7013738.1 class I SAM-dependent RNA methyltransferase [Steroidobacteraceae bacterium]
MLTCSHRPPCPGCPRFGEPGIAAAAHAALESLARAHGLPGIPVVSGATTGFRLRARLAIRGRLGAPKLGMFELGTHRVVHIPNCIVQHPLINRAAGVVRRALVDAGIAPYAESVHHGLARYLQVVVERSSGSAQLVIVGNSPTVEPLTACLELIRGRLGEELHSLWFNAQCERTNTILGREFTHWCGPPSVVERFGGAAVHYPPGAFGQNNLDIAERIVEHVREQVPAGARVAEFYAGVGAIGLSVLPRVSRLRLIEISPQSVQGLALGLEALAPVDLNKIEVIAGSAGTMASAALGADVVIADPPRKGLDRELLQRLVADPPGRFVYVSCGLDSFAADTARLTASGALRLRDLRAFNLMPYTEHVETVACFERA